MSPSSLSVFVNPLLPMDSIALGRLVIDVHTPWQDFCPSSTLAITKDDVSIMPSFRIHEILDHSTGTAFHGHFTKFLTSAFKRDQNALSTITATEATSYRLLNSGFHFRRMCKDKETRSWLETVINEGWDAYMVVGIHTIKDAEVVHRRQNLSQSKGSVRLPLTDVANHAIGAPSIGNAVDIDVGGEKWNEFATSGSCNCILALSGSRD